MGDFYISDKIYKNMVNATFGSKRDRQRDDGLDFSMSAPAEPEKKQGFLGDVVDSVQMGMWQGASDLARFAGVTTKSKWANDVADWAAKRADENLQTMSPEMQQALDQSAFDGIDQDGEGMGVLNARWWAGNIGSMLGANADVFLTLGSSALLTTGAKVAGKAAMRTLTKEGAEKIGQVAIEQAVKRGIPAKYKNMIGITAAMSAMQAGSRANSAMDEYLARADEDVVNDEEFREAYHSLKNSEEGSGLDHNSLFDLAKERVAHNVGRSAALNPSAILTDVSTNAVAGLGGGFMGLGRASQTLKGGFFKGALTEGATEAAQGAVEQYAINQAAKDHYDPNRDVMQGVADNAVNSAIIGGGFGAPMGMVDTVANRMAVGKQKKELLKMVNTGNETIDAQLKNYVDMVNQTATDLDDLVSASRVRALNALGMKEARAKQIMLEQQEARTGDENLAENSNETAQPATGSFPDLSESEVYNPISVQASDVSTVQQSQLRNEIPQRLEQQVFRDKLALQRLVFSNGLERATRPSNDQPSQYGYVGEPSLTTIQQEDYDQAQGFDPVVFTESQSMDMAQPNPITQDNMQNIMQETAHNGVNPSSDGLLGNINDDIRLSLNESANSDFAKAVDDVVSGRVKGRFINMGTTPDVFKMIGLPDSVIFMKDDVIEKALAQQLEKTVLHHSHPHNITAEDLKKLPSQLNNPVAIFKSDKKSSNPNGYVVLTELIEKELGMDKPVIAALHVKQTPKGLEVINIASVHGRRKGQLQSAVEGEVLYWNKTKGYPFSDSVGLQLPRRFSELDNLSISNIKTEAELSQYQAKQNNTRSTVETERFKQVLSKAVGESAVKNINVIQSGTKPEGFEHLITADVEGWFDPKSNQINLVSDGIHATPTMTREQRIAWVAWHELAHRGVNVRLKGEYKSIMHRADSHPLINAIATAIQQDRQGKHDSVATSRHIAVEEALAETFAAYQTGNFNELAKRYGVNLTDKGFKPWLRKFAEKVRALVDKLFGRETAEKFSDSDLVMLITEIGNGINGESAVENKGVLFSTPSESVTDNTGSLSKESDDIRFSRKVELNNDEVITQASRRLERIATDIRNGVTYISNRPIELGATPKIFERLGVPQLQMRITEPSKLFQIVRNQSGRDHDISPDVLAEIPYKLQEPLAVFNSDTEKNALVAVMELKDSQNRPVIAAVHINKKVGFNQINKIASIYGKDNAGRKFAEWTEKGHLRYLNNEKSHSLLTSFGLQSPTEKLMNGSLENNVLLQSNVVNSNIRFSRSQSALDLSISGKAKKEQGFWGDVKTRNFESLKKRFNQLAGKVDENFADSLRPVNDWIDQMQFSEHTGKFNGRDHEKRRLKDAMYTAKGIRDALNSELEQHYLKPILEKIASIVKKSKERNEQDVKAIVGTWLSTRYSIEKNAEFLATDEKAMLEAKQKLEELKAQNANAEEIHKADLEYRKAEQQYQGRKADVESLDFSNDRKYRVGVAGGWSVPLARQIMKNMEDKISKSDLESIGELVADLNQARLEIDRKSGRYTEEEYQRYKQNRHYVPLTGDPSAEEGFDFIAGAGGNALNISQDRSAKGRTGSEADDAITTIWEAVGKSTTYSGWSEFKNKIDDLYETEISLLKEQGYSESEARNAAEENLGIGKRRMQGLTRTSDNVLIAKNGGVYYEYALPDKVMNALKADNVEHANEFLKVLSKPTSWYARGVTQWTVTFAPINMLRDTWEKSEFVRVQKLYDKDGNLLDSKTMDKIGRALLSNALFNPAKAKDTWAATKRFGFGQELRDNVPAEKMLKDLLKQGGLSNYGTYLARTETDLIKRLKRENNPIWKTLDKAGHVLESYNKVFDTVSALSAYKALIENGVDSKQAAAVTLELTNFRKTGAKMRGIKALYMFSQPTVMGAANLARYLSTRKGQLRFAGYFAVMTALYTVLRSMDDDDEGGNKMDQLGDITRYIPIPTGGGDYLKIPVGFGMPQMVWNFAVNTVKGAVGDISYGEATVNMMTHSMKTFAPVSPSEISALKYPLEKAALTITPSILQPLMQNALNRTAFGSQITPSFVRTDKLKAEQSKSTTAGFWKDTALAINDTLGIDMHPEQVKNLIDGYSGMLGSMREISTILVENPNRELLGRNTRMPFINQLYGAGNEFAIQSRYYEATEEAQSLHKQYESLKARGELNEDWLTDERKQILRFHEQNKSLMSASRSEKAKLTKLLRSGKISADAYENRLKAYNDKNNKLQAAILHKWRLLEGLNTTSTN